MWIVGTILLVVVASLIVFLIMRRAPAEEKQPIWDIPRSAGTYTSIVGTLAGFAVASSFFLANLSRNTDAPELETVIGMLIIGFLVLVGTAMIYGTTPNLSNTPNSLNGSLGEDKFIVVQRLNFILGHIGYYSGITLTWLSLRPLTNAMGLQIFPSILTWLLLLVVIAGAERLGMFYYALTDVNRLAAILVPTIPLLLASLYRLLLVPILPMLWPADAASLSFAVIVFILVLSGFAGGSLFIYQVADLTVRPNLLRRGENFLFILIEAVACSTTLLWFSVVLP